jgi:hypothetical protein
VQLVAFVVEFWPSNSKRKRREEGECIIVM